MGLILLSMHLTRPLFRKLPSRQINFRGNQPINFKKRLYATIDQTGISAGSKLRSFKKPDVSFALLLWGRTSTTAGKPQALALKF
jgi:hypothetical protein